jgi:mRNA-degrading endonuclease toxin of MazEF toxin-antitoxin module
MTCRRGDVVLVIWPVRQTGGFEQRPAVIVQSDAVAHELATIPVVPLTSQIAKRDLDCACRIRVAPDAPAYAEMGLRTDTVILVDQVGVVLDREIRKRIGTCPLMESIDAALRHVLAL